MATYDEIQIGDSATFTKTISESDVYLFAGITGDLNPAHTEAVSAANGMFKQRIAHGMLSAGFISAVLGTKLPGPGAIYVSQSLNFKGPVRVGDTVLTRVVVADLFAQKRRAMFDCTCTVADKVVLTGEAILMVPARPALA